MYPQQTGHLGCRSERARTRARVFARDKRPRKTVKIEFSRQTPASHPSNRFGRRAAVLANWNAGNWRQR